MVFFRCIFNGKPEFLFKLLSEVGCCKSQTYWNIVKKKVVKRGFFWKSIVSISFFCAPKLAFKGKQLLTWVHQLEFCKKASKMYEYSLLKKISAPFCRNNIFYDNVSVVCLVLNPTWPFNSCIIMLYNA